MAGESYKVHSSTELRPTRRGTFAYYNTSFRTIRTIRNGLRRSTMIWTASAFCAIFCPNTHNTCRTDEKSSQTSSGFNALTAQGLSAGFWDNFALGDTWASKVLGRRCTCLLLEGRHLRLVSFEPRPQHHSAWRDRRDRCVNPALPTFYALGDSLYPGTPWRNHVLLGLQRGCASSVP